MTAQFIRKVSLIVGDSSTQGLDLSQLHIRFSILSASVQSPKHTSIRVYNLSDTTVKRMQKEFTRVFLSAGYGDNVGQIFAGSIKQIRRGRENATDTFVEIIAADGDTAYNFATVNATLSAGWTATDVYKALLASLSPYAITAGYAPAFPATKGARGKAMYGMTRDYLRELADSVGASWNVQDGRLNIIPIAGYLPGPVPVITDKTGMIGVPVQTVDGITVKSLLNPGIVPGGRIQINNASVQQIQLNVSYQAVNNFYTNNDPNQNAGLDADGFYKVYALNMHGDTRGVDFYSEMICAAVNGTAPLTSTYTNAVASGS
jgi:hypothetical protein